jgi:hypothetical protein
MSDPHAVPPGDDEPPAIEARGDTGTGFWNVGWPLLALALIVLMTVHACVK